MFLYANIQWAGTALAGINAGDGVNHVTIPVSLTSNILDIEETSNVGIPGIWIFKVGEGNTMFVRMYVCVYVYTYPLNICILNVCNNFTYVHIQ